MKCFKHLCAKWFLCLVLFSGWGFTLNVSAAEDTNATEVMSIPLDESAIGGADVLGDVNALTNVDSTEAAIAANMVNIAEPMEATTQALLLARAQDVDRLSRIIQPEAGKTFEDKVCVGLTVLHRVDNPNFPNTVEENINAPSQYTKPAKGEVSPENLMAAEFAMQLWESGISYAVLPGQFLYFAGNGRVNKFHDSHGHYYNLPDMTPGDTISPYITGPDGALFHFLITFLVTSNFSMYLPNMRRVWA